MTFFSPPYFCAAIVEPPRWKTLVFVNSSTVECGPPCPSLWSSRLGDHVLFSGPLIILIAADRTKEVVVKTSIAEAAGRSACTWRTRSQVGMWIYYHPGWYESIVWVIDLDSTALSARSPAFIALWCLPTECFPSLSLCALCPWLFVLDQCSLLSQRWGGGT